MIKDTNAFTLAGNIARGDNDSIGVLGDYLSDHNEPAGEILHRVFHGQGVEGDPHQHATLGMMHAATKHTRFGPQTPMYFPVLTDQRAEVPPEHGNVRLEYYHLPTGHWWQVRVDTQDNKHDRSWLVPTTPEEVQQVTSRIPEQWVRDRFDNLDTPRTDEHYEQRVRDAGIHPDQLAARPTTTRLSRRTTTVPVPGARDHALTDSTTLAKYGRVAQAALRSVAADRERRSRERVQGQVRRYSATEGDVNNLLSQIRENRNHSAPGSNLRGVAADALQEQGRDREADVLRNHPHHVEVRDGRVFRRYPLSDEHRNTASGWHGGGGSGLYQIASTGRVNGDSARQSLEEIDDIRNNYGNSEELSNPDNRRGLDGLYDYLARIERETADEQDGDEPTGYSRRVQGQVTPEQLSRRKPRRYGLLPRDEITTFSDQGNTGGQYDPNNVADAVFADRLEDAGDPRHLVIRRDLEHRTNNDKGPQDADVFTQNHRAYHRQLGNGARVEPLGRGHPNFLQRRLPDGTTLTVIPYGERDRYENDEDHVPTSYEIQWDTPHNMYYGAFSPEERDAIVEGLRNEVGDQEPPVDRLSRDHTVLSKEKARRRYAMGYGGDEGPPKDVPVVPPGWDYVDTSVEDDPPEPPCPACGHPEYTVGQWGVRTCSHCGHDYAPQAWGGDDDEELPWDYQRQSRRRYAAYRAPAGGMVTRGTAQKGGQFVPDMNGAFVKAAQKLQGQVTPPPTPTPVRKQEGDAAGDFSDNASLTESKGTKPPAKGRRARSRRKLQNRLTPPKTS